MLHQPCSCSIEVLPASLARLQVARVINQRLWQEEALQQAVVPTESWAIPAGMDAAEAGRSLGLGLVNNTSALGSAAGPQVRRETAGQVTGGMAAHGR